MKRFQKTHFVRKASSRLGPLLMLFQRSPVVQWLFPEVKIIGSAGLGEITKWTVATVAGLGAYDSVSGASEITQLRPYPGSTTVTTAVGASLAFIQDTTPGQFISTGFLYQVTGTIGTAGSWSLDGDLPPGLTHANPTNNSVNSITGVPTEEGDYPIIVTAWRDANQTGPSLSQPFLISIGPAVISTHPASVTISSGATATLGVTAESNGSTLSYQWFKGTTPTAAGKIANATGATFTTPSLTATTSYLVKVARDGIVSFSNPATVTIGTPDPFQDWRMGQFNSSQLADTNISGPSADPDGDTFTNATEYVFGTNALARESSPLSMTTSGANISLSLTARSATGAGYAGKTRHYAIETRTDLVSGGWSSPAGFSDITGSNQTVTYTATRSAIPTFYRLRVWLTP